jgi:hypothetical protein
MIAATPTVAGNGRRIGFEVIELMAVNNRRE